MGTLNDADLTSLLGEAAGAYDLPQDGPQEVLDAQAEAEQTQMQHRRRLRILGAAAALALVFAGVGLFVGNSDDAVGRLAGAQRPTPAVASGDTGARSPESPAREQAGSGVDPAAGPGSDGAAMGGSAALGGAAGRRSFTYGTFSPMSNTTAPTAALAPAAAPAPASAAAPAPAAPTAGDGVRVVKKGELALVVADGKVTPTLTAVQALATRAGGFVQSQTSQESGPTPSGSVLLRVPVGQFETVVTQVRNLDAEVRISSTSGADVTAQFTDLQSQLTTLTAARERFLVILSKADKVGDILAVQQRVDDVTGQIDRIKGQQQLLADQSDNATLLVSVTQADDPALAVAPTQQSGLTKAFEDAWTGFRTGVEALIRLSGRAVLLLLLAGVAYLVARLAWRATRRQVV